MEKLYKVQGVVCSYYEQPHNWCVRIVFPNEINHWSKSKEYKNYKTTYPDDKAATRLSMAGQKSSNKNKEK